jgi:hypothetical protein
MSCYSDAHLLASAFGMLHWDGVLRKRSLWSRPGEAGFGSIATSSFLGYRRTFINLQNSELGHLVIV